MDILKSATDWAKAEVFSTSFFIVMGLVFVLATIGFWQLGKTEIAKAYVIPTLVAGALLLTIGLGLFFTNKARVNNFETAYNSNAKAFVASEIVRADKALNEYRTIVFKAIPLIIAICALLIVFIDKPLWRASMITTIAMLVVILLIDGTAKGRLDTYKKQLVEVQNRGEEY
ncbi:hypothetical protein [Carboxylicivirga sp. M1479]|uniref:hypothetical protein n=1 Tax=Carboxylicivirga sp. M1479 TaxID=2594476 RepID=UPI0011789CDB|nr:hypothetical protein [Carboxylicivirga sp. M1479]TRX62504.1 hypothetical protein FNN09_19550 [Carboxylicivirga sp. M1479]